MLSTYTIAESAIAFGTSEADRITDTFVSGKRQRTKDN
jgi:hypothetical protein